MALTYEEPDENGCERLTPAEIQDKFGWSERAVWRKLDTGEWLAVGMAEHLSSDGATWTTDVATIPQKAIRVILSQLSDTIEINKSWGQRLRIKATKEIIEVLVSPAFTPELFPTQRSLSIAASLDIKRKAPAPTCSSQDLIDAFDLPCSSWKNKFSHIHSDGKKYLSARLHPGKRGKNDALWLPIQFAKLLVLHGQVDASGRRFDKSMVTMRFGKAWPNWKDELVVELEDVI